MSFVVSCLIGVLGGLGVGSGGLLTVYLGKIEGYGQLEAQTVNLIFFIFCAGASLILRYSRRAINARDVIAVIAGGVCGSFFGSGVAVDADGALLRILFGLLMTVSGVISLIGSAKELRVRAKRKRTPPSSSARRPK